MSDVKLQRRHFELIADTLHKSMPDLEQIRAVRSGISLAEMKQWKQTVAAFIQVASATNPSFKPDRFMKRCIYGR